MVLIAFNALGELMYQELPNEGENLLIENDEHVIAVHNLAAMRDFMSGQENYEQFCIITSERLYSYKQEKGKTEAAVFDVDDVKTVSYNMKHNHKILLMLLYVLLVIAVAVLLLLASKWSMDTALKRGKNAAYAFGVVFFYLIGYILILAAIVAVFRIIKAWRYETKAVVNIQMRSGEILTVALKNRATNDMRSLENAIRAARYARKTDNTDLFLL